MTPSVDPSRPDLLPPDHSAAFVAFSISHILEAIIAACDKPTLLVLAATQPWMAKVVHNICNNPTYGHLHLRLTGEDRWMNAHVVLKQFRPSKLDYDLPSVSYLYDDPLCTFQPIEALDLHGKAGLGFKSAARRLFPNVVRLCEQVVIDHRRCWCDPNGNEYPKRGEAHDRRCRSNKRTVTYPNCMPRARCVVAFSASYHPQHIHASLHYEPPVEVCSHTNWVFDRAVYHFPPDRLAFDVWMPELPPAWHTLFIVKLQPNTLHNSSLSDHTVATIARKAGNALLARKDVPGAHVTLVVNDSLCRPREDSWNPCTDRHQWLFRGAVVAFLTSKHSDKEFIADAVTAIKFISWDEYRASTSPRQFELEIVRER